MINDVAVNVKLDLTRNRGTQVIYVRQNDTKVFNLHIILTNNGKVVDLSDASAAVMFIKKPSGTEYANSLTRNGNELSYTIRTEDVDEVGEVKSQIYIGLKDLTKFTSPVFIIQVYSDIIDADLNNIEIDGVNSYTFISDYMTRSENAAEAAAADKTACDTILTSAKTVKKEIAEIEAEITKTSAEIALDMQQINTDMQHIATDTNLVSSLKDQTETLKNETETLRDETETIRATAESYLSTAQASAEAAQASAEAASSSETNAKTSELNAKTSETNAQLYASEASADAQQADGILQETKELLKLPSFRMDDDGYLVDDNDAAQYDFAVDDDGYLTWKGVA